MLVRHEGERCQRMKVHTGNCRFIPVALICKFGHTLPFLPAFGFESGLVTKRKPMKTLVAERCGQQFRIQVFED